MSDLSEPGQTPIINDKAAAVAAPAAGLTIIATIPNPGFKQLCFHFDVATQALDDFDVLGRAHNSAQLQDFTPTSWTALPAGGRILEASADLNTVAAAGNGYFAMDVSGLTQIVVKASGAVNNASVTSYWSFQ